MRATELAAAALDVFRRRAGAYPGGISVPDLLRELSMAGVSVDGDNPERTLSDALNRGQVDNLWARQDGAVWLPGTGETRSGEGLSGRPLAEALYEFVKVRWPGGTFHYEAARVALEKTGVQVKGTGSTTRSAMDRATDLFAHVPGQRGMWRWVAK